MREYHKNFPISAPEDDYDDRINLYEMYEQHKYLIVMTTDMQRRGHLCASTLYPDTAVFRKLYVSPHPADCSQGDAHVP
jgi:protein-ribulosamine 3-kinase